MPGRHLLFRTTTVWRSVSVGPPNPKRAESEGGWHRCHTRTKRRCVCVSYSFKCCALVIKYKEPSVSLCATERVLISDHFNQNHVILLIYLCSNCTPWTLWVSINKDTNFSMFSLPNHFICTLQVSVGVRLQLAHRGEGHMSTLSLSLHYQNICFMFVSLCVHKHGHAFVHPHVSCGVETVLHWLSADCWAEQRNRRAGRWEDRREKKRKQDGSEGAEKRQESVWPWVFWTEVSGLSFGEGVWLTAGRHWWEHKWETFHLGKVMCSSERNAVNAHTRTYSNKHTYTLYQHTAQPTYFPGHRRQRQQ